MDYVNAQLATFVWICYLFNRGQAIVQPETRFLFLLYQQHWNIEVWNKTFVLKSLWEKNQGLIIAVNEARISSQYHLENKILKPYHIIPINEVKILS